MHAADTSVVRSTQPDDTSALRTLPIRPLYARCWYVRSTHAADTSALCTLPIRPLYARCRYASVCLSTSLHYSSCLRLVGRGHQPHYSECQWVQERPANEERHRPGRKLKQQHTRRSSGSCVGIHPTRGKHNMSLDLDQQYTVISRRQDNSEKMKPQLLKHQ